MHISTDTNGIIKKVIATTASVHDTTQLEKLTVGEEKAIFADSGYMSKERKRKLRAKGIFNGIIERGVRGQSKLRGLVELPFAFIKHHMNFKKARYLGIEKN